LLYEDYYGNQIEMRWAVHVERMEGMTGAYRILLGKGEWKKPCGRQRSRRDGW